jgi:hypothetical protein
MYIDMYVKQNVRRFCSEDVKMTNNVKKVMAPAHLADEDLSVPDRRRRIIPEVALVRRWTTGFRELGGGGLREGWVKGGQFTSNLRPRWTDPVTARRVPRKWTIGCKGSKGSKESKGS